MRRRDVIVPWGFTDSALTKEVVRRIQALPEMHRNMIGVTSERLDYLVSILHQLEADGWSEERIREHLVLHRVWLLPPISGEDWMGPIGLLVQQCNSMIWLAIAGFIPIPGAGDTALDHDVSQFVSDVRSRTREAIRFVRRGLWGQLETWMTHVLGEVASGELVGQDVVASTEFPDFSYMKEFAWITSIADALELAELEMSLPKLEDVEARATAVACEGEGLALAVIPSRAARIAQLSPDVGRKLAGARGAIEVGGADYISQAAHSLVEAIDRMCRVATAEEVMSWLATNGYSGETFTRTDEGGTCLPTKRGQLLYLFCGGSNLPGPQASGPELQMAKALMKIRDQLQTLKHADLGSETERHTLESARRRLESGFVAMSANWIKVAPDFIDRFDAFPEVPLNPPVIPR